MIVTWLSCAGGSDGIAQIDFHEVGTDEDAATSS